MELSKKEVKKIILVAFIAAFVLTFDEWGIESFDLIFGLRNLMLVEKVNNDYRITEFNNLHENFKDKVEAFLLPSILARIKDYLKEVDEKFK